MDEAGGAGLLKLCSGTERRGSDSKDRVLLCRLTWAKRSMVLRYHVSKMGSHRRTLGVVCGSGVNKDVPEWTRGQRFWVELLSVWVGLFVRPKEPRKEEGKRSCR